MVGVASVLEHIVIEKIINSDVQPESAKKLDTVLVALSILFASSGILLLIWSLYVYLDTNYPQQIALALTGAVALGCGALSLLSYVWFQSYKVSRIKKVQQNVTSMIKDIADNVDDNVMDVIKDNPKTTVMLTMLAGFIAGTKV